MAGWADPVYVRVFGRSTKCSTAACWPRRYMATRRWGVHVGGTNHGTNPPASRKPGGENATNRAVDLSSQRSTAKRSQTPKPAPSRLPCLPPEIFAQRNVQRHPGSRALHPTSSFWISPQGNFPRGLSWNSPDLVDSSRTPSGIFFGEVHPGSEMANQNDQNKAKLERKLSNHDEPRRFVIGAVRSC